MTNHCVSKSSFDNFYPRRIITERSQIANSNKLKHWWVQYCEQHVNLQTLWFKPFIWMCSACYRDESELVSGCKLWQPTFLHTHTHMQYVENELFGSASAFIGALFWWRCSRRLRRTSSGLDRVLVNSVSGTASGVPPLDSDLRFFLLLEDQRRANPLAPFTASSFSMCSCCFEEDLCFIPFCSELGWFWNGWLVRNDRR